MGLFGAAAVIPYGLSLTGTKLEELPMSPAKMIALSLLQNAVILAVMVGVGLLAAGAIGLDLPILRALLSGEPILPLLMAVAPLAILAGSLSALLLLALEVGLFRPRMPEAMKTNAQNPTAWQGFLASFYGGINEEIMLRLFVVSGSAWLFSRLTNGTQTDTIFWVAILFAALLFGIGHLPATARMAPLTPLLIVRALLLNGILGGVAGYLFWRYGLEAAMIAHFSVDIVLHVLPVPFLKNRKLAPVTQSS
jgi:hypothetical protein